MCEKPLGTFRLGWFLFILNLNSMYIFKTGNYMISIDWLQAYCVGGVVEEGEYSCRFGTLSIELQDGGTANFSRRSLVKWNNIEVATLLQCPKMATLDRLLTELKLHNRVLYTASPVQFLKDIIDSLNLIYKGISRLDLALDCNSLVDGGSVERLIHDFVVLKHGDVGHVVRRGSARYNLHGNNHRKASIRFESIKFGSPQADVVPYIYNKSIELLEVKDKPWIREAWKNAGLVHLVDMEGLQRLSKKELDYKISDSGISEFIRSGVWRFEISIKGHGRDLLNLESGELFKIGLDSIGTAEKIEALFKMYAEKYFDFRRGFRGERIRDYKKVQLWQLDGKVVSKQVSIPTTGETGRFDVSVSNYLTKILRTYSDLASPVAAGIAEARDLISAIAGARMYKLKEKRYEDYLNELMCNQFWESMEKEVMDMLPRFGQLRDELREHLENIDWSVVEQRNSDLGEYYDECESHSEHCK